MARILIIEDYEDVRRILATHLRRAGHQVSEARDGREGIEMQAKVNADVVITDIVMPEMEGLETITTLRRSSPNLPIIAISGVSNAALYLASSRALGARFALAKPITANVLTRAVEAALTTAA